MTLRMVCLLSAALVLPLAACGESKSETAKPAAAPAKPEAPAAAPAAPAAAPAANPVAAATEAVKSAVDTWTAEAAKADKPALEKVIADLKALIPTKEAEVKALSDQLTAKASELAKSALGGGGSDALKADVDKLKLQLDGLKKELAGLNEKLSVFVAELAKRPA